MAATDREYVKEGALGASPPEATKFQRIKTSCVPISHGVICEEDLDVDLGKDQTYTSIRSNMLLVVVVD